MLAGQANMNTKARITSPAATFWREAQVRAEVPAMYKAGRVVFATRCVV